METLFTKIPTETKEKLQHRVVDEKRSQGKITAQALEEYFINHPVKLQN